MLKFNRKIHKSVEDDNIVEVSEMGGIRSLHLGSVTVQSSMKVKEPFALELAYTRGMMGFLLFSDSVNSVLTIGLGGGSVPKYIFANCPEIKQTIIEINSQIISIARSHFYVPDDDDSLTIIHGDGIAYLNAHRDSTECLMIDAFDRFGIPPDFCSQDFFNQCELTLKKDGIFAINLWGSDKKFDIYLQRIEQSFKRQVLMLPTGKPGNIVVFGFKNALKISFQKLMQRALQLEKMHAIEFASFAEKLRDNNHAFFSHHSS